MTIAESTGKSSTWPRLGWWVAVLLVFALQFGFIVALGSRTEKPARTTPATSSLELRASAPNELMTLRDPTMFILPHREGFSGQAWLQMPPLPVRTYTWTEPQQWLDLRAEKLGGVFQDFMQTNDFASARFEIFPEPAVSEPNVPPTAPLMSHSTLQVKGDLANRAIVSQPDLPAMPGADLLANSSVQVLVDAGGNVLSAVLTQDPGRSPVLYPSGNGSSDADRTALDLAKSVRFAPLTQRNGGQSSKAMVGTIIFEWQTIPATNR